MIRALGLFVLICAATLAVAATIPLHADYTDCALVSPGPIMPSNPDYKPYGRKPDEAALHNAYGSTTDDSWPPLRFQGDATAYVHFVALNRIDVACGVKHDSANPEEACQQGNRIVLPNPCLFTRGEIFARLACHELAHAAPNNWPGDHPR